MTKKRAVGKTGEMRAESIFWVKRKKTGESIREYKNINQEGVTSRE